jgi:hypothetical protein
MRTLFILILNAMLLTGCGEGDGKAVVTVTTPGGTAVIASGPNGSGALVVVGTNSRESENGCEVTGTVRNDGSTSCDAVLTIIAMDAQGRGIGEAEAAVRSIAAGAEAAYLAPLAYVENGETISSCADVASVAVDRITVQD